jgi:membrane-bound lytic murein transglycosylase A
LAAALAGCARKPVAVAPAPAQPLLASASFHEMPGWAADHVDELMPALRLQCRRLALLPVDTALGGVGMAQTYGGRAGQWADACAALRALPAGTDLHGFFETWFAPYRVGGDALVTGYFEPVIPGARSQGGPYQTPVLARPADLVQGGPADAQGRPGLGRVVDGHVVPYFSRAEIEAGAMGAQARPIAWLASPVDMLFAQIQGSARVQLADGGVLRLAFDGRNGRPYTPIGRVLEQSGAMTPDQVTMQSIRAWLEAHPAQAKAVMDRNESYVFFKVAAIDDPSLGPAGAMGVALTPGRSAAVDRAFLPLGSPVFVASSLPDGRAWQHLVLAQDLGSAIAGQARVDVFWGVGPAAAAWAGRMRQKGVVWLLLPRPEGQGKVGGKVAFPPNPPS